MENCPNISLAAEQRPENPHANSNSSLHSLSDTKPVPRPLLELQKSLSKLTLETKQKASIRPKKRYCSESKEGLGREEEALPEEDEHPRNIIDKDYFTKFRSIDKKVAVDFKNGNTYEGRISRYLMHGEGTYTWKNGAKYQGTFVYGTAEGVGLMQWPGKGWYFGEMSEDRRHGSGICLVSGPPGREACYYGGWKEGKRHGQGIQLFGKSDWYNGEWKDDLMHGEGLRLYPSGSYYQGSWRQGSPHGSGRMVWSQRDIYTGKWKNGRMHGRGTYIWRAVEKNQFAFPMLNMYEGSYKNGKRHGSGKLLLASGAMITGHWRADRKEGAGRIFCKNGLVIESNALFLDDKVFDIGEPQRIPAWNRWYLDFLGSYQEGLTVRQSSRHSVISRGDEWTLSSKRISKSAMAGQRRHCLNNVPLLAPTDTLPLWAFIEMASCLAPSRETEEPAAGQGPEQEARLGNEEEWLRKVIRSRLPDLRALYQRYSRLCCDQPNDYPHDCFLLRLMLWQLCLDCRIDYTCLTLRSLDRKVGLGESPLDVVPLSEMIHYLLHLAFELCMKTRLINHKIPGLCGAAFDYFLTKVALPAAAAPRSSVVRRLCNWLPLSELHGFYASFGSPVTIQAILDRYYWREEDKEDRLGQHMRVLLPTEPYGKNVVDIDGKVVFKLDEAALEAKLNDEPTFSEVEASSIMQIGEERILDLLLQACPKAAKIIMNNRDYELSFLEFGVFVMSLLHDYKALLEREKEEERVSEQGRSGRGSGPRDAGDGEGGRGGGGTLARDGGQGRDGPGGSTAGTYLVSGPGTGTPDLTLTGVALSPLTGTTEDTRPLVPSSEDTFGTALPGEMAGCKADGEAGPRREAGSAEWEDKLRSFTAGVPTGRGRRPLGRTSKQSVEAARFDKLRFQRNKRLPAEKVGGGKKGHRRYSSTGSKPYYNRTSSAGNERVPRSNNTELGLHPAPNTIATNPSISSPLSKKFKKTGTTTNSKDLSCLSDECADKITNRNILMENKKSGNTQKRTYLTSEMSEVMVCRDLPWRSEGAEVGEAELCPSRPGLCRAERSAAVDGALGTSHTCDGQLTDWASEYAKLRPSNRPDQHH